MENSNSSEFQLAGEKEVELWLTRNGYTSVLRETLQTNESGLKATGSIENILVQVRTFLHPHRPFKLSDYEVDKLTRRALKLKHVAYAAYVVMDDKNNLTEEIIWERLS